MTSTRRLADVGGQSYPSNMHSMESAEQGTPDRRTDRDNDVPTTDPLDLDALIEDADEVRRLREEEASAEFEFRAGNVICHTLEAARKWSETHPGVKYDMRRAPGPWIEGRR